MAFYDQKDPNSFVPLDWVCDVDLGSCGAVRLQTGKSGTWGPAALFRVAQQDELICPRRVSGMARWLPIPQGDITQAGGRASGSRLCASHGVCLSLCLSPGPEGTLRSNRSSWDRCWEKRPCLPAWATRPPAAEHLSTHWDISWFAYSHTSLLFLCPSLWALVHFSSGSWPLVNLQQTVQCVITSDSHFYNPAFLKMSPSKDTKTENVGLKS